MAFPLTEFLTALVAGVITLFVILDPIGVLPFFLTLTKGFSKDQRRSLARKAVLIAIGLLLVFAFLGDAILIFLGVSIFDFEIAGGILLLIFSVRDALSNEPLGVTESTAGLDPSRAIETIAVIPIATPLLAGPGSLTTVMLLTKDEPYGPAISVIAIVVDCFIAWVALRLSGRINDRIGPTGLVIIGKVMDILMAAIAISYLTKGIIGLGL